MCDDGLLHQESHTENTLTRQSVVIQMQACVTPKQLTNLLAERLDDDVEESINQHLLECNECRELLDRVTTVPENLCIARPGSANDDNGESDEPVGDLLNHLKGLAPQSHELDSQYDTPSRHLGTADTLSRTSSDRDTRLPEIPGYEVVAEVACGGMGVIYKARQLVPSRVVALKMMKSGQFANREEVARFRKEAEAAAALEHPNIVPIYEVGQCDGRDYYSMRFIDGCSLHEQLREGPLQARDAASLVKTIAEAVQFAHDQGIVHRDLKPANILIDQNGDPKVTDFGIARHTAVDNGVTETGQILGTPGFMPPEQASGKTGVIGPRADVYSLGAILYATLTGRPPFQAASVVETLQQVVNREPVSPRLLNTAIDKDLETICLKSLEKSPELRYASANQLAADLGRFIARKPILARPVSRLTHFSRWCQRNPLGTAVIVLLVLLGIVSPIVAYNQSRLAENARDANVELTRSLSAEKAATNRAVENAERASRNLDYTDEVVSKFVLELGDGNGVLSQQPATQLLRKKLLLQGRDYYEKLIQENPDAELTPRLAAANYELALILSKLSGESEQSVKTYGQALELFDRLARKEPHEAKHQMQIARIHGELGRLHSQTDDIGRAQPAFESAVQLLDELVAANPTTTTYQVALATTLLSQSNLMGRMDKPQDALEILQRCRRICNSLIVNDPDSVSHQELAAACLLGIAMRTHETKQPEQTLAAYEEALENAERIVKGQSDNVDFQDIYSSILYNFASYWKERNQLEKAIGLVERSLVAREQTLEQNPHDPSYQTALASGLHFFGNLLLKNGEPDKARAPFIRACIVYQALVRDNQSNGDLERQYFDCRRDCSIILAGSENPISDVQQTSIVGDKSTQDHSVAPAKQYEAACFQIQIADSLLETPGDGTRAILATQTAKNILERLADEAPSEDRYRTKLAHALVLQGLFLKKTTEPAKAEAAFQQADEIIEKIFNAQPANLTEQDRLAKHLTDLVVMLPERGEESRRIQYTQDAIKIKQNVVARFPNETSHRLDLAGYHCILAYLISKAKPQEGLIHSTQAVSIFKEIIQHEPENLRAERFLDYARRQRDGFLRVLAGKHESVEE